MHRLLLAYFGILIDYGFDLSATREVSIHRDNKEKLNEIYSAVTTIKIVFFIISFFIISVIIFSFEKFHQNYLLFYFYFFILIDSILSPIWFFKGIEKMKYITFFSLSSRILYTIGIFLFIKEAKDYYLVPLLNFFSTLIIGVFVIIILFFSFKIKFQLVPYSNLIQTLKDGWNIFKSTIGISLYRNINVLILGFVCDEKTIGYYAIAEKILKIIQFMNIPVGETLYPHLSNKFSKENKKISVESLFRYGKYFFLVYMIIFIVSIILSKFIITFIAGKFIYNIAINFYILSFIIVIGGLNYYFGILGLVALGMYNEFAKIIMKIAIVNIFTVSVLSYIYKDIGASISFLIAESILLVLILQKLSHLKKIYR